MKEINMRRYRMSRKEFLEKLGIKGILDGVFYIIDADGVYVEINVIE